MEGKKLYVGNLNYEVDSDQLKELFSQHGTIEDVTVIDRKGFGFVEFSSPEEAEKAKEELNGQDFKGRAMRIDVAKPKKTRSKNDYNGGGGNRW